MKYLVIIKENHVDIKIPDIKQDIELEREITKNDIKDIISNICEQDNHLLYDDGDKIRDYSIDDMPIEDGYKYVYLVQFGIVNPNREYEDGIELMVYVKEEL